jgi:6-pyruvoyltetrahydropterin/6-carboxytetrahydropterin synthase
MSERYEVGVVRELRATHVMPGEDGPEGLPHAHEYRIEVTVTTDHIDDRGMALDLLTLEEAVDGAIHPVREADLDLIRPAHVDAVTVEVFARWIHEGIVDRLGDGDIAVRVWEHESAFGGYRTS